MLSLYAAFLLSACATPVRSTEPQTVLRIGLAEGIDAPQQIANGMVHEGLAWLRNDGRAEPRLAESWEWEKPGLRLIVKLRPGVRAHDGSPVNAAAVVTALKEAIAQSQSRRVYWSLGEISDVSAVGDDRVAIDLRHPAGSLPEELEVALSFGPKGAGTGAFRPVTGAENQTTLERFPDYYRSAPALERVMVRAYDTYRTAWTSMLRGELDVVAVPPDAAEFLGSDEVQVSSFLRRYQYIIAFNNGRPPFTSPPLRRALNMAIDRQAIVTRMLRGHGLPANGPLWPQHWAYDSSLPTFSYDPDAAAALLDSAGFPDHPGPVGTRHHRLTITCIIPANYRGVERIALEIQRQLYAVGVDLQFEPLPVAEYSQRLSAGTFEAVFIDVVAGPSLGRTYAIWRSARQFRALNVFSYENAEAEQLFDTILRSSDETVIRSAGRRLQRVFLEDPPALFIAWTERTRAFSRRFDVRGLAGRDPLLTVWLWQPRSDTNGSITTVQ